MIHRSYKYSAKHHAACERVEAKANSLSGEVRHAASEIPVPADIQARVQTLADGIGLNEDDRDDILTMWQMRQRQKFAAANHDETFEPNYRESNVFETRARIGKRMNGKNYLRG